MLRRALRCPTARGSVVATTRPRAAASRRVCTATPVAAAAMTSASSQVLAAGSPEPAAGPDRTRPTFITTWSCPYAQRTWIALAAKQLQFTPVFVDLQNKPEWFFSRNPYGRVPTLVWQEPGGKTTSLYESLVCNEYIADLEGPALLPADAVQRAHVRLLIDQFGAKVGPAFGKTMFAEGGAAAAAGEELTAGLQWLEGELSKSDGPLFLGKDLTLVDAAVAPFLLRLPLLEGLAGYKLPQGLTRLQAYIAALEKHPAVQASIHPPDSSKTYQEQMLETYKEYVAKRRAAAAAST